MSIRKLPALLGAVAAALIFAAGLEAQAQKVRVPQAFAVVQAPEAAVETCHGNSAQAALDCARKQCTRKAGQGACFAVTVCQPAGWAGVMGVRLAEVHFSNAICGAPTKEAVIAALKAFCEGQTGMQECALPHIWAPDGKLHVVNQNWTSADFKK